MPIDVLTPTKHYKIWHVPFKPCKKSYIGWTCCIDFFTKFKNINFCISTSNHDRYTKFTSKYVFRVINMMTWITQDQGAKVQCGRHFGVTKSFTTPTSTDIYWINHGYRFDNPLTIKTCSCLIALFSGTYFTNNNFINNHLPSKVWDEITYLFLNFNTCTIEVCEWIGSFIPLIMMDIICYSCWDLSRFELLEYHKWKGLI